MNETAINMFKFYLCFWLLIQIVYFFTSFFYINLFQFSYIVNIAKSSAAVINMNSMILLLAINPYFKMKNKIVLHKCILASLFLFSLMHTIAHLYNYHLLNNYSYIYITIPGVTGILVYACIFVIILGVLLKTYEFFIYSHIIFAYTTIPLLILHGSFCFIKNKEGSCSSSTFWIWIIGPLFFIMLYKIHFYYTCFNTPTYISNYKIHSNDIIELEFKKRGFSFKSGEYIYVNCPNISRLQWHPFTISSNPLNFNVFKVFIKNKGDWTSRFIELIKSDTHFLIIHIGKGASANYLKDLIHYDTIVIIASGIGITPFISLLKLFDASYAFNTKKIILHWICRDPSDFNLFLRHLIKFYHKIDCHLYITKPDSQFYCKPFEFIHARPDIDDILHRAKIYENIKILHCCSSELTKSIETTCKKYKLIYEQGEFSI